MRRAVVPIRFLGGLALVVGVLAWGTPAHSQEGIRVGPLRVHPFLEFSGEYDDNITLAPPGSETSDFVWTISPGITLELPGRRYAVRLGYRADILEYTENDALDTVHHTGILEARYDFPWGLGLSLNDTFKYTDEFTGFPVPSLTERVPHYENTLNAGALYQFADRWSAGVDYTFYWIDYVGDPSFNQFDRQDHQIALSLYYRVFSKTSVLGEYDYQIIRYAEAAAAHDRDSDSNKFKVGLKGDLTSKTTVLAKIGWEFKDYQNRAREDWDGLIVEAEGTWKYADPSQLRLFVVRQNVESVENDPLNNYYVTTFGGAELQHHIGQKVILSVRGLVGENDYPNPTLVGTSFVKRSDFFYEVRASLKYQMRRWLAFEVRYTRLVLDSNIDEFDYTDNRIGGYVLFTY